MRLRDSRIMTFICVVLLQLFYIQTPRSYPQGYNILLVWTPSH